MSPARATVPREGPRSSFVVPDIAHVLTGGCGGPFRMMDKIGRDVVLDIEEHDAAPPPGVPAGPRELLGTYVHDGRLGVKSGRGFFADYR